MRTKVVTTSFAFGLAFAIAGPVEASTITFETLPDGFTTPTDNAALTSSYTVDGTTVTFGFDINGDLEIDADAILESRNDDYGPGLVGLAYTYSGVADVDATPTGEGGDWLLRAPQGFNVFLVKYTGASAKSASGQLWDIDWGEKYLIEALDPSGTLINYINTPTVPNSEGLDTFNGDYHTISHSAI